MGITGKLVKSVFSRNRSVGTQGNSERSNVGDKRWSTVRLYLCNNEFNSLLAEEDSASVKSSEVTVTQRILQDSADKDVRSQETEEDMHKEKHNSTSELFRQEDAAIIIQTAFRNFVARSKRDGKQEHALGTEIQASHAREVKSPSRDSIGTSIEVQTGKSGEPLSVGEENRPVHHRLPKKARTRVLKLKEEWDDSTVSSNLSKMRIQNRLEATNRRERALAYAFSQQLRICSKKQTISDGTQPNMSWSWLERWMATRIPECSVESCTGKELEPTKCNHRLAVGKKFFDLAGEENESCGSNEIPFQFDILSMTATSDKNCFKPAKSNLNGRTKRTISRRKTAPSHYCPKEQVKVNGALKGNITRPGPRQTKEAAKKKANDKLLHPSNHSIS